MRFISLIVAIVLWPLLAFGQAFSPGTPYLPANTIWGNVSSATAVATSNAVGSCSGSSNALLYTSGTGFGCSSTVLSNALTSAHIYVGNGSNVATDVAVSGDLTLANTGAFTLASGNAGVLNAGTLLAARMPALTGDVTTSAGAVATTVAKIQTVTVSGTTGTGNVVFSASPTFTGAPILAAPTATTIAVGGATLGSNAAAITGTVAISGITGIGPGTPAYLLTINANTVTLPAAVVAGTVAQFGGADTASMRILVDGFAGTPQVNFRYANGTAASPTAATTDNVLGQIAWLGRGSTVYSSAIRASIRGYAAEAWTDTAQGTYLLFSTTAAGGVVAAAERMRIDSTGNIYAPGLASSSSATTGTLCWQSGSSPAGLINVDTTVACLASAEPLKNISGPLTGSLDRINALKPIVYTWKFDTPKADGDPGIHYGLGAFATAYASESLIARDDQGNPRAWRQDALIADLVGAVQEQQRQIDALKGKSAK